MRKLSIVLLVLCGVTLNAQDPIFSQYYAVPLQVNPAFAGNAFAPRVGMAYRNQWSGFSNAYRTYAVYYEHGFENLNSGLGFHLEGDNAGDGIFKTTRFSAIYAYKLNITDDLALKLGAEGGFVQSAIAWDKLVFPDQIDPIGGIVNNTGEIRPDVTNHIRLDASAGLLIVSPKWWFGSSVKHMNTPDEAYLLASTGVTRGLPVRYTAHGGMELVVKEGNKLRPPSFISPNFLFVTQGPYQQLNVGAYAGIGSIFAGAWFRHTFQNSDAVIMMAGFREGIFKLGLSYDITVSGLSGRSGGTYEMTFGIFLDESEDLRNKKRRAEINNCMRMFQ